MRQRKYRGLTKEGKWVYGWYMEHPFIDNPSIFCSVIIQDERPYEVIPETVGQDTGLKDKNDKEIWEGDIVQHSIHKYKFQIIWGNKHAKFGLAYLSGIEVDERYTISGDWYKIIGNIHENPELLEE